jgi:hypothetical protein
VPRVKFSLEVGVVDNQVGSVENSWLGSHQRLNERAGGLLPMIHMGARPYQPALGRFLSVDGSTRVRGDGRF